MMVSKNKYLNRTSVPPYLSRMWPVCLWFMIMRFSAKRFLRYHTTCLLQGRQFIVHSRGLDRLLLLLLLLMMMLMDM